VVAVVGTALLSLADIERFCQTTVGTGLHELASRRSAAIT
jgi:hypothetical protein